MKTVYLPIVFFFSVNFCLAQDSSPYRIFFTTHSAKIDTIPSPTAGSKTVAYTVSIDLNGDKIPERFESDEENCGSGGCQWIIYEGKTNNQIGEVEGIIVYILKKKQNGFPLIETYWKGGCCEATVQYYSFQNGEYKAVKQKDLNEKEMEEYFDSKPPISDEFKELP